MMDLLKKLGRFTEWVGKTSPMRNTRTRTLICGSINARQPVTAIKYMNPDQVLFLICASFEAAKFLIPVAIFGYMLIRLNP